MSKKIKWKKVILCDVKGCTHKFQAYWSPAEEQDQVVKACMKHIHMHDDPTNSFTFYELVEAGKPETLRDAYLRMGVKVHDEHATGAEVACSKCR